MGKEDPQTHLFFITPLETADLFLGHPWFTSQGASVDYHVQTLTFKILSPSEKLPPPEENITTTEPQITKISLPPNEKQTLIENHLPTHESFVPFPQPEILCLRNIILSEDDAIRQVLPEVLHDYVDVFWKSAADALPDHCPCDHTIPLEPGTTPPMGPVYSLSVGKHKALKEYIEENLAKGFIRSSSTPASSPVLFVPKPNGELRLCIDYLSSRIPPGPPVTGHSMDNH